MPSPYQVDIAPAGARFLDNLTHTLVGAAISKAGAERYTPLATTTLILAANAPDVDMIAFAGGPYFALAFRRGLTHGWPALVVLPFVVAGLVLAWDRFARRARDPAADPARAGPTVALAAIGLWTHPALDWMNVYGMRWRAPIDGTWSYGDALFIVDPWIWLVLGGSLVLAARQSRRTRAGWIALGLATTAVVLAAPIGVAVKAVWCLGVGAIALLARRRGAPPGRRTAPARWALLGTGVYLALMMGSEGAASRQVAQTARAYGLQVVDVMVAPAPGNPFAAEVEVRTPDAYVPGVHRWLGDPRVELRPDSAIPLLDAPPGTPDELVERLVAAARRDPRVRDFLIWARFPYVAIDGQPGRWRVTFSDVRYDEEPSTGALSGVSVLLTEPE